MNTGLDEDGFHCDDEEDVANCDEYILGSVESGKWDENDFYLSRRTRSCARFAST